MRKEEPGGGVNTHSRTSGAMGNFAGAEKSEDGYDDGQRDDD